MWPGAVRTMGGPGLGSQGTSLVFGLGRSNLSLGPVCGNNDHLAFGDFDGLRTGLRGENA